MFTAYSRTELPPSLPVAVQLSLHNILQQKGFSLQFGLSKRAWEFKQQQQRCHVNYLLNLFKRKGSQEMFLDCHVVEVKPASPSQA